MPELCLTLLCPRALEERVLDALLTTPELSLLTSVRVAAHGLPPARLSATEQVLGHAAMTRVEALLDEAGRASVLSRLRQQLAGTGLRYWIAPVAETGALA